MKKVRIVTLSIILNLAILTFASLVSVDAMRIDSGRLESNRRRGGRYGVYTSKFYAYSGETSAYWINGGAGTVYVKMTTMSAPKSATGGYYEPGYRSVTAQAFGVMVDYHGYFGVPAY